MNRRDFNKTVSAAALASAALSKSASALAAPVWSFSANVAECCSCEIPCPCNFGRPTSMRCDGNRLIEIYEGSLDGSDLAGIRFLVTFEMGKWSKIYIDEALSDAQMEGFEAILPLAFGYFADQALLIERVPMAVTRTEKTIEFVTPASSVLMKQLEGLDGGPISVSGLPSNVFHDYVQYESVRHVHNGDNRTWEISGTNGFTSRMIASS